MIQPISQLSTIRYPAFKNSQKADEDNFCLFGGKAAGKIKSEQDFQKKLVEQNERLIVINGTQSIAIITGLMLFNIKLLTEIFQKKKAQKYMPALVREFESLKNNSKIPTIENCKSINKTLKNILEKQINHAKAGSDIISETGNPKASNRLLLYGPAGSGKSYFAKIFSKSIDAEYMEVMQSDINSMWAGEGVSNIKTVFDGILKTAKNNSNKKYVVTLNEIDAMVAPADKVAGKTQGSHWVSILEERSAFLNYLERLKEETPNVIIIGTTNISPKNNGLDRAAMSRFQNLIEVPYPDKECLYEALKMNLETIKNKDSFINQNDKQLQELAQIMSDRKYSFRNLEHIVNEAKNIHLNDNLNGKKENFKFEYLKQAQNSLELSDGELENLADKTLKK